MKFPKQWSTVPRKYNICHVSCEKGVFIPCLLLCLVFLPVWLIIRIFAVDLSSDYNAVEKALWTLEEESGPIYMLVNCAGGAVCGKLEDTSANDIQVQSTV